MWYDSFNPWQAMRRLQEEMVRQLATFERPRAAVFPPVNIWTNAEGLVLTAELPGVEPSSLEISALKSGITIRGERRTVAEEEGKSWHRRERRTGRFSRTVELPYAIDADSVDASCVNGVLRIGLRRPEEERPRRIEVKSA